MGEGLNVMSSQILDGACGIETLLIGEELPQMAPLMQRLWPICRSLTGPGVRESLDIVNEVVPLERYHVASGSQVFDWSVPAEWRVRDAWVEDESGERIIDFLRNNLHLVGYSEPVDVTLTLEKLQERLHSIPDMPEAIPYITSYYRRNWGFCLTDRQRRTLRPGNYRCVIDSELDPAGQLDFAQARISGKSPSEVFFSTYLCHPSMANNELSGPVVQATLLSILSAIDGRRLSYRGAFTTETLGTLCYLREFHQELSERMLGGYVVSCVGDDGPFTYVRSLRGDSEADRIFAHVLKYCSDGRRVEIRDFHPMGSDERQYCSPGFNFPVGSFSRSRFEDFPYYHTSLDDMTVVGENGLGRSLRLLLRVCQVYEMNLVPHRTIPYGEPQLGKRGLYRADRTSLSDFTELVMLLCALSDGRRSLLDIAERAGRPVWAFLEPFRRLLECQILAVED